MTCVNRRYHVGRLPQGMATGDGVVPSVRLQTSLRLVSFFPGVPFFNFRIGLKKCSADDRPFNFFSFVCVSGGAQP